MADASDTAVRVVALATAEQHGGGFVGAATPRLCWRLEATRDGVVQQAFEIEVAATADFANATRSARIEATRPTAAWPAAPLASRDVRWVRVRVWTDTGRSDWSAPLRIEAALLSPEDWQARPISPPANVDRRDPAPVPLLRAAVPLDRPVMQARLYVTALGVFDAWINGRRVGDALLEPGWTTYGDRLLYAAHDVTALLVEGENVIAAAVGDGWWRGWLTWMERRACYGATTALLAQLEIIFEDGSRQTVATGEDWRGGEGAWQRADLYDGCETDLRAEPHGWREAGFDDAAWQPAAALPLPATLALRPMPPVRIVRRWPATPIADGDGWMIDTGQNLAGYLRITMRGEPGTTVTVRHAEMLDNDGRLHTVALRNAKATDRYVLADANETMLEPLFTFHGFRHARIEADGPIDVVAVEVCTLSSDLVQIGHFACCDPRVNRLYENVRWSQIGNFLALPTDCPQRDERLGWTGDIQVFADTACANADARTFLGSWLRDLAAEQRADGNVTSTVPDVIQGHEFDYGGVGWGDAATLVPWSLYRAYGDLDVLAAQFDSMVAWVEHGLSRRSAAGVWEQDFHLGDWLDPGAPADQPEKATTDSFFVATAYLSHSARILSRTAAVLGRDDLADRYEATADEVAQAAWARWHDHARTTQAGCAMAIEFGIAPEAERVALGQALADLVERNDGRIATGFLGTPLVLPALTATGHVNAAYRLLLNEQCPGWLYQVARGATTMWERWDAVQEDGSLHAGAMAITEGASMISFNHYAYGAVAAWLYRTVAGIAPGEAGYERIVFAPRPGGGLTQAEAAIDTPFGRAAIAWQAAADTLTVTCEVPPGATARFDPPPGWQHGGGTPGPLGSGRHVFRLEARR